jgi:hypothetical protein
MKDVLPRPFCFEEWLFHDSLENKRKTQDPGSNPEPGAPSAYLVIVRGVEFASVIHQQ